jgi:hypothetical protein
MLPLLSPHYPRWFELYKTKKMVDFSVNLDAWLQETSLFGDEPIDSINIDDFLSNEKANFKGDQTVLGLSGLEWFDEKVDLSVLNNPNGLLDHRNETQQSMEDDTALLLGLLDSSGFNPSNFDIFNNEEVSFKQIDDQCLVAEPISSETLDTHLASPRCNSLQVNSPVFFPVQSPASPYSDISDSPEESSSSRILLSPQPSSFTADLTSNSFDLPQIHVSVCDNVEIPSNTEPVLSIEEVSQSVRKRKFVSDGESIPKVKVILTECVPAAARTRKPKDRRERKKVQNKEAAARYRIKKRVEEKVLSDEVESLESQQKELQDKHDGLQSEIKYLKSLMCEILTKKGIIK